MRREEQLLGNELTVVPDDTHIITPTVCLAQKLTNLLCPTALTLLPDPC